VAVRKSGNALKVFSSAKGLAPVLESARKTPKRPAEKLAIVAAAMSEWFPDLMSFPCLLTKTAVRL
jgi:hypothetical protein